MQIDHKIQLSTKLLDEAYAVGQQRHRSCLRHGLKNTLYSSSGREFVEGEGVCGEFAFVQMIKGSKDAWERVRQIRIQSASKGTDLGDCSWGKLQLDIKTTKYSQGHLLISPKKLMTSIDGFVLMTGFGGKYQFAGYISQHQVRIGILLKRFQFERDVFWIHQKFLEGLPRLNQR